MNIFSPNQPGKSVQLCYPRSQSSTLWPYAGIPNVVSQMTQSNDASKHVASGVKDVRLPRAGVKHDASMPLYRPNIVLLTPAIFGSVAAFIVGFGRYGHSLSCGYNKYIFFAGVYAIIASLGAGAYIYEVMRYALNSSRLSKIILPLLTVIVFFALLFNLTYTLYPFTFSGTIGDTKITQFLSFLSLSIGSISVGETFNINPERTGSQILAAIESFWNLFAISLIIALIV